MIKYLLIIPLLFSLYACSQESQATIVMSQPPKLSQCSLSGYTRIAPSVCIDSDGTLSALRTFTGTASEGDSTNTVIDSSARYVLLKAETILNHTGSSGNQSVTACASIANPGVFACGYNVLPDNNVSMTASNIANEVSQNVGFMIIPADETGAIGTRCSILGNPTSATCAWYVAGYYDP